MPHGLSGNWNWSATLVVAGLAALSFLLLCRRLWPGVVLGLVIVLLQGKDFLPRGMLVALAGGMLVAGFLRYRSKKATILLACLCGVMLLGGTVLLVHSNDGIRHGLAEGAVAVQTGKGEEFRISPSEQLTYHKESRQSDIRTVQTQMFTSWTRGEYIFKDATLDEILTKLSHWYDFRVQYEDQRLKDKRFSCTVDRSISLQQLLELLSYTSDVKLKRTGDQITISVEPTSKEVE